jgi:hypothetical protein
MNMQLALLPNGQADQLPEPTPRARTTDPHTSHAAAASLTLDRLSDVQRTILRALSERPMTDEQLTGWWTRSMARRASESSIRSRRAELVAAGLVVDTGQTRPTLLGRAAIVWGTR